MEVESYFLAYLKAVYVITVATKHKTEMVVPTYVTAARKMAPGVNTSPGLRS